MHAETKKLEFDKILLELRKFAVSDLAKQEVEHLSPSTEKTEIERLLSETQEAKLMIIRYDQTPMTGVLNIKEAIRKAHVGSMLSIDELLRIVSHQEAVVRSLNFIKKVRSLEIDCDHLVDYYDRLVSLASLKKAITDVIDQKGDIIDTASVTLAQIRKKIKITEDRIENKMNSLLRSEANKLTDNIITIRNNRLVLPVKAEHKNNFKGVVHDTSSSGETYFIEPLSCFTMNNELQTLFVEEQREIEKILQALTDRVREHTEDLKSNLEIFTYLDIVFAKAKYAIEYDCHQPLLLDQGISLLNARHPLIPKETVVGNNIQFHTYRHIIITGPNTGGKTVVLKTLGLLSLMLQSGMLIPVDEGSKTMIFNHIFADIGDEQSIEQSLSTFSSHISKIIHIINHATENSLILLDEVGSGTDPKEGASLAISIINHLRKKQLYSMVTTHYSELKTYAYDLDDTVNASVEFDIDTLRPTYKLKIGIPGTSNAIDIASRLGLQKEIIEAAKKVSLSFDTDISKLIKKLEQQSLELDEEINQYHQKANDLEAEKNKLEQMIVDEKIKQNKRLKALEEEQKEILKKHEDKALKLIDELNQLRKNPGFKDHVLAELKHETKALRPEEKGYQKVSQHDIGVGDRILVIPYQRQGVINKALPKQKYEVLMGTLSMTVEEKDLEYIDSPEPEKQSGSGTVTKTSTAKVELDLRGMRYLEAVDALDQFVDSCLINNLEFAYVIHGYGTGALMKAVKEYVAKSNQIKSSRSGGPNEGGKGVTVINFK